MARPVKGDPLKDATPILSPTARPTDTFVKPSKPSLGKGQALAQAVGALDRAAQPILSDELDEAKEREIAEGQEQFRRNREDFKTAVKNGTIPAGASPYVRKGYRMAQLHTLGSNYATQLARSLEETELYKVDDPQKVEQHMTDFYNQFTETNEIAGYDPVELAEAFTPMVQQAHDGFRRQQAQMNVEWVEQQRIEAFEQEVFATLDMQGFTSSASGDVQATAGWLKKKAEELDSEGLDRTMISEKIVDIVTGAAEARNNPAILDVLSNLKLGTGPLSNTQYGRVKMDRAKERIINAQERAARRAARRRAEALEAQQDAVSKKGFEAIISGDEEQFEEALEEARVVDDDGKMLHGLWRAAQSAEDERLENRELDHYAEAREFMLDPNTSVREANEYMADQVGRTMSIGTLEGLMDEKRQLTKDKGWNKFYNSPMIRDTRSAVGNAVAEKGPMGMLSAKGAKTSAFAERDFNEMTRRFYMKHDGDPDPDSLMKFLRETEKFLIEKHGSGGMEAAQEMIDSLDREAGDSAPDPDPEPEEEEEQPEAGAQTVPSSVGGPHPRNTTTTPEWAK